jgi:hypothetical protein
VYALSPAPTGATVSRSASPTGVVNLTPTGNAVSVSKVGTGTVTLTATITACGGPVTLTKTITAGSPVQPGPITEVLVDYYMGKLQLQIAAVPGAASYNWYKDGVLQTTSYGTFIQMPITKNLCNVGYGIEVEALNSCGASPKRYQGVYVPCDGSLYTVSPNPATDEVTVSPADETTASGTSTAAPITEINIYDQQGRLKKHQKYSKVKQGKISVSSLPTGIYFVEIVAGSYWERQQLSVLQ